MHKHKIIVIIIAVDVATFLLQTVDFQVTVYCSPLDNNTVTLRSNIEKYPGRAIGQLCVSVSLPER